MFIIKIGGGRDINIKGIIEDLATINERFIIVHGANALRDQLAQELKKPKKIITSVSGYSSVYSDVMAIDVMMMAYSGLRNKRIVELCQQQGINAIGLTGLDGKLIEGERNKGIRIKEDGKLKIVRDLSGKPKRINTRLLQLLMENGFTPVISVPIIDEQNTAINSENDDIVSLLQMSVQADAIIQLIEAAGFLDNPDDPDSVVAAISRQELSRREEQVSGRMKRKILALRKLFDTGAHRVIIADGRIQHPVQSALAGEGTIIQ